jgi:uncharacterized protein (TIGR02453 family)
MSSASIHQSTFRFLKSLSQHNDRDWFNANRQAYELAYGNAEAFFDALIAKLNTHDSIETPSGKKSLYRIYNDVRFSKDKSPYNPRFAGGFKRTKPLLRGGYYLWLKPGASRAGCGFTYPSPQDLQRIRMDILHNHEDWTKILRSAALRRTFGEMKGEQVKTTPKGFPKDHEAIDLLRYKQYWFERSFTDKEVLDPGFLNEVNKTFKAIRPFFDYMSDMLMTDLNGEPLG